MIQSYETVPYTVINTEQMNSRETERPGSAIKGQDAEELSVWSLLSLRWTESHCFYDRKEPNCVAMTSEKVLPIPPQQ